MQSRVRIRLQTAATAGQLEELGTASTDPNLLHTDVHPPPETLQNLPRMTCSYSRHVHGMVAPILQWEQQEAPAIDAPKAEDMFQGASGQATRI